MSTSAGCKALSRTTIAWIASAAIRFWVLAELNRVNRLPILEHGTSNAAHAVHHSAIDAEDDRIGEIDLLDEPNMVDDPWHRRGPWVRRGAATTELRRVVEQPGVVVVPMADVAGLARQRVEWCRSFAARRMSLA